MNRIAEIAELIPAYGEPVRRCVSLDVSLRTFEAWSQRRNRREEVVLFLLRGNGRLLLHTKGFYPPGAFRALSGGIKPGEPLLDAVRRESREETGLDVKVDRLLAIVDFRFQRAQRALSFQSYLFLLHESGGELGAQDVDEGITAYREIALEQLPAIAEQLEDLPANWSDWGAFRALPHRVAAEILLSSKPGSSASEPTIP
jgi:ADP-ribose pyrophosphatase YjhB (NUDIX family)